MEDSYCNRLNVHELRFLLSEFFNTSLSSIEITEMEYEYGVLKVTHETPLYNDSGFVGMITTHSVFEDDKVTHVESSRGDKHTTLYRKFMYAKFGEKYLMDCFKI